MIENKKEEIIFNAKDEKELYVPLLFFVGREIVNKKMNPRK